MNRTDLIHYILENDRHFNMKELVNYSYEELVMIKVRIEVEKNQQERNGYKGKN